MFIYIYIYIYTYATHVFEGCAKTAVIILGYLISEKVLKEVVTAAVDRLSTYQLGLKQPRQRYLQGESGHSLKHLHK